MIHRLRTLFGWAPLLSLLVVPLCSGAQDAGPAVADGGTRVPRMINIVDGCPVVGGR